MPNIGLHMIELERTFLAKRLPAGLKACKHKDMIDLYIPKESEHPVLRITKNGEHYEMTKKKPVRGDDASKQEEQTIILTKDEIDVLMNLPGKKTEKTRHYYPYKGKTLEIDVFQGALKGLVLVDAEFSPDEEKNAFAMPDFCLADVTHEKILAGGMVCGKSYEDLKNRLEQYPYQKLVLD